MRATILLVEDNKEMLDFVADDLSEKYHVLKAIHGKQALEILKDESVQIIISDVMMPVMDGFEFCRTVKSSFEYSHIPVILLTARTALQSKIEGLELGADAYIEKPFSPEYLHVQIANLLKNRDKLKEYFAQSPLIHIKSIAHSRSDELFLEKLNEVICNNIEDEELDVEKLARIMAMSRPTLYRKIKSISNLTANELINVTRLKKAAELLAADDYKIYEVATMVGFGSQTTFGRSFLKQFGMSPSAYQQNVRGNVTEE
ncbi:DNA-binding response regulator, OmpR family, contains REC and winged-helix (wHTH) domain [Filimonas lacunae]|uniref:DNA-binding response regulator, OmpR family, contains REC and winged-helix (WHTH) domain n=1 Tax=Filimonas lacunae TaxID=477680 RepID=A0A173MCV4_9BACT|nr:response regulator [Filimonas lacunae]BAV05414.1 DNA-binding response regulator, AraC family [Filimonas lacunae]SIT21311.1 DNA-binding response regulator, OmpR family, contains REC and winged-helix (wHTH) domain [Filimonas lacunae]